MSDEYDELQKIFGLSSEDLDKLREMPGNMFDPDNWVPPTEEELRMVNTTPLSEPSTITQEQLREQMIRSTPPADRPARSHDLLDRYTSIFAIGAGAPEELKAAIAELEAKGFTITPPGVFGSSDTDDSAR